MDNDEDLMKKKDLTAHLVQSGPKICLAVIEVVGFLFRNEKVAKSTARMDDLEDPDKQIKVVNQIVNLGMSSSSMESWDWNKQYVALDIDSQDQRLTHHQYVLKVASALISPLAPSVVPRPLPSSELDMSNYSTWRIPSTQLQFVFKSLWDALEPESEKILGNVESLYSVNNSLDFPNHDINGK